MTDRLPARTAALLVACVAAVTCLLWLGRSAVTDADEAFYAEAGREMVESGDWLTPRYNYENRFQKPVLYYWGVAATYTAGGVSSGTARLPSALAGIGLALIAWWCGRRWFDAATGITAGLIVGSSLGLVSIARLALPDTPLAFFIALAIVAGVRGLLDPVRPRLGHVALAGAAAGAAFLTKGPVGILVPGVVLGAVVLVERRWRALRPLPLLIAFVACVIVGVPWYVVMTREHGVAYLQSFFVGDNLERFATDRFNDPRPIWFYLPIVLGGLLPWTPFVTLWVQPAWRVLTRRTQLSTGMLRLITWIVLPLILFTASVGKQPRYILPIVPAIGVALAVVIERAYAVMTAGRRARLLRVSGVIAGSSVAVLGAVLAALPADPMGVPQSVLLLGGGAAIVAGVVAAAVCWWLPRWTVAALTMATLVLVSALQFGLLSTSGPETVELIAERIRHEKHAGTEWTTYNVLVRNLVFYVASREAGPFTEDALVAWLEEQPDGLVVLKEQDFEKIAPRVARPLYRLGEWQYFNVAAIRAGMLIDRNPSRRTRTVLLVSTRPGLAP